MYILVENNKSQLTDSSAFLIESHFFKILKHMLIRWGIISFKFKFTVYDLVATVWIYRRMNTMINYQIRLISKN